MYNEESLIDILFLVQTYLKLDIEYGLEGDNSFAYQFESNEIVKKLEEATKTKHLECLPLIEDLLSNYFNNFEI